MILDLSNKSTMQEDVYDLLKEISLAKKDQFNSIIDNYSNVNRKKVDWWVQRPASRNTHQSFLFYQFCCLHLVDELVKSGQKIEKVICDSAALSTSIQRIMNKKDITAEIIGPRYEPKKILFHLRKSLILILKTWKRKKFHFRLVKSIINGFLHNKKELILIDKFIIPGFVIKECYYNGLLEHLNIEQKDKIFFVPTFAYMNNEDIKSAVTKLKSSNVNYLFKEDFLTNSDLLYSLLHLYRVWFIKTPPQIVLGIDFSPFVREELLSDLGFDSALEGLLNFRFAKRLKQSKFKIPLVIDWWEGQPLDKGWSFGFKTFFPESILKGYIGYPLLEMDLQLYPTDCEVENNVCHDILSVIGEKFCEQISDMNLSLNVEIAPAFRFDHVWKNVEIKVEDSKSFKILLALSINLDESVNILEQIIDTGLTEKYGFEFMIKTHPVININTLRNRLGNEKWPNSFIAVEGSFSDCIRISNLLILVGISSVGLEAIALGIPVIIIETLSGIAFDPIPDTVPNELWKKCRSPSELFTAINAYRNRPSQEICLYKKLTTQIKKHYFEPVTKKSVNRFLKLGF